MCSSSPPPAPDYTAAANATSQGNLEAARAQAAANRVNQVTPYGTLTYSHAPTGTLNQSAYDSAMQKYYSDLSNYNQAPTDSSGKVGKVGGIKGVLSSLGGTPAAGGGSTGNRTMPVMPNQSDFISGSQDDGWTATQTLSPEQQDILNKNQALSSGLLDSAQTGLGYANDVISHPGVDTSKLPQNPINPTETYTDAYNRYMQPNWDRQQASTNNNLSNQGITMGSEAWKNAQQDLHDQQARDQLGAITTGMNTGLNANQQGFQQAAYNQMQPINVINALRTGNQVQGPTFVNPAQQAYTPGPDLLGASTNQYNAALGNYNAQAASNSNLMNGVATIGSAFLMSDRRLKQNIKRIGTHDSGIGIYSYVYIWGEPGIGVMADELEKVNPDAVAVHSSGYKMVDYAKV